MPRRAGLFVFLGLAIALVFVTGISAGAEPDGSIRSKKADVAAAQDRLVEIRLEASSAEAAYNNSLYEMNQLNGQITRTTEDLRAARERLAVAKKTLEERAAQVYKSGNVAYMDVLVGVDNFSEFASRLNLWVRLLARERVEFLEVREARDELAARRDRLEAQREQRVAAVETAIAQRKRANEAEAQAEAYLNSLSAELRDEIQAAQDRQAAQARAAAASMVEKASEPEPVDEPEPIPEVQVSQVKQTRVPRADLQSERAAARREAAAKAAAERTERLAQKRAAERKAARKAAEQAAKQAAAERQAARLAAAERRAARQEAREEAQRQAELAAQRAAERRAAREQAEREAERAARRAAIEEAAAEQAAAEREAARLAAERRTERRAEQRAAERRAEERAEASASASAAAERRADRRAERRAEASASASAAAERRAERRAEKRVEASASASASSSDSAPSSKDSGRDGGGATAASSASASASASSSPAPGGGGGVSALGDDVLAVADDHLGTPYVFSPPGPCVAFEAEDCSCFTMLVFQEFGIALPDSPGGQMGYGTPVHGAPQAGDLLFWSEDGSGYITHVGIAIGDGTTIHAQVQNEVTITSINLIEGYVGARRLL
jgi:peptidoglycan DL-endopeptidase RipA